MNKPVAPKKPSKRESPPEKTKCVRFVVLFNYEIKELSLATEDYCNKFNEEEDMFQHELDNLEKFSGPITLSMMLKIKELINAEYPIEDFSIEIETDYDGYQECYAVYFDWPKDEKEYKKELEAFEKRFLIYDKLYSEYQEKLKIFQEYKKEQKRQRLEEELKKL